MILSFLPCLLLLTCCHAFSPTRLPLVLPSSLPSSVTTRCNMIVVDPMIATDVGIAVVSAAAGAATQLPRINKLQHELELSREALTQSEQEMVSKISKLEDKLYEMDTEFEQQTTRFKKQYPA